MSTYYLQPNVSTWQNQYDPFIATILAYDDNNIRISNKQLYVIYDITYDDSIPDLINNGKTLYSDKDGRIEFHFAERCHVSIDLYMVSEYDASLDIAYMADPEKYTCYHVCDNVIIPFKPYVTSFEASYISDVPVAVNSTIPRKYVQVLIRKSDNTSARFTIESDAYKDYIVTPNTIEHINDNVVTVSYRDPIIDRLWQQDIIVTGKVQELEILATYIGILVDLDGDGKPDEVRKKQLNNLVSKSEILVTLITYDGYTNSQRYLDNDEWEFTTFPQITNVNLGIFTIMRNDLRCNVRVPFLWYPADCWIDAWYEGYPVLVGQKFIPSDFRIYLYKPNHNRELLPFDQCQIVPDDYVIHNVGTNWFTIRYKYNNWTISDKVAIIGYEETKYEEKDFELLYYNPTTHSIEDVTGLFDEACTIAMRRYFNWSKILSKVSELVMYGKYKLHAPKLCGLSSRCDTDWIFTCTYNKAIDAMLIKQYVDQEKEDNTDG